MARAIFRVNSGRTDIDPRHEHEAVKCTCGEAELCTDHIIVHCRLFDKARDEARNKHLDPPRFTKELVLDNIWGENPCISEENTARIYNGPKIRECNNYT
jgi:hypothetical protein